MKNRKAMITILVILGTFLLVAAIVYYAIINDGAIKLSYKYIGIPSNNYIAVSDGKKYGYVTDNGEEVTKLKYDIIDSMWIDDNTLNLEKFKFVDGLAQFNDGIYYGLLNEKGEEILDANYTSIEVINKNLIIVSDGNSFYFINYNGNRLFNVEFEMITSFDNQDEIFLVSNNNKYALFDNTGKLLTDFIYDNIYELSNSNNTNYVFCATYGEYTHIYIYNKDNKTFEKLDIFDNYNVTSFEYYNIYLTNQEGQYSLYDIKSKEIKTLNNSYVYLGPFVNSVALAVNSENVVGYIDENEEIVIDYQYDNSNTSDFTSFGYAVVGKDGLVGVINTNNDNILKFDYLSINIINNDRFLVSDKNNKMYIIDKNANKITKDDYDTITFTDFNEVFVVSKEINNKTKYGVINSNGKEIIPVEYEDIKISDSYFILKTSKSEFYLKER